MRVQFRPTVAADLAAVTTEKLPHRIQAVTAIADGRILGVGGIGFRPDGTVIAFAHFLPEFRKYPTAIHRAGREGMRLVRRSGAAVVVAEAQPGNPAAAPWLERFGFRRESVGGRFIYVWERGLNVE
jgi:hypothetical protein